ncbi:MAG: zinc-ribbon domain containing protein [Eubacteriales bacterium]
MYEDKTLACADCGDDFVFSASEQEFYAEKGFQNEPKRCPDCRKARKSDRRQQRTGHREMHDVVCDECGATCKVPFLPKEDKPVYCDECFSKKRESRY